ncbi:MAG: PilN domain-containing protein [Planctomycetota bacterium]|jgi:Tfp pilus assembly protein PilN
MQIRGVNLVPADRREARRRQRRVQAWIGVCLAYAVAWVVVQVAVQVTMVSDDRVLRGEIEQARSVVQERDTAVAALKLDRQQAVSQLHANLAVGKQPDWSILLALLASTLEDEIVLSSVRLKSGAAEESGTRESGATNLDFAGFGQSQAAVSRFVLRLEAISLFRSVKLQDTRREPFLADHAIAFRVECVLDDGGGADS